MFKSTNIGLLILRLAVGGLMLLHGLAKLNGLSYIKQLLAGAHLPTFLGYGVYITEIVAPFCIVIGHRTRLGALVMAFGALVAIYLQYFSVLFTLNKHGGWRAELIGLYFFGAIVLLLMGGGKLSLSSNNKWD